jgi:hypothetical protein
MAPETKLRIPCSMVIINLSIQMIESEEGSIKEQLSMKI